MSLIWQDLQAIAANSSAGVVRLSGNSSAFLLSASSGFQSRSQWIQDDDTPVTDSQWDEIEALIAEAYTELMTNSMLGVVFPFVTAAPPNGALECDGTTHLRTDYPALYALLDSAFVVDSDHFIVPDLQGRVQVGSGTGSGLTTYAPGDTGGEEAHLLTLPELASHSHGVTDPTHAHSEGIAAPAVGAAIVGVPVPSAVPAIGVSGSSGTGISIQSAGSDTAHENRQPYLALRMAIWAE